MIDDKAGPHPPRSHNCRESGIAVPRPPARGGGVATATLGLARQVLGYKTVRQFFKFGIVGAVGFAVDAVMLYFGIYALGLSRVWAGMFSFPFAVTSTWIGNRMFTFRDAEHEPAVKQLAKFVIVCGIGLLFNRGTYTLLVSTVPVVYAHPVLGLVGGTCVAMFFNFYAARRHVFGM